MARPTTNTIEYFSHDCQHRQTMYILESRYKNDGYAFWFKLLETLGTTPGHFLDLNDDVACEFLAAKTNLSWSFCDEILTLLAKIGAICPELWSKKIVWSQNFVDRIAPVYAKRRKELPVKPSFCDRNADIPAVSVTETRQSKVKERKEKNNSDCYTDDFEKFWNAYPKKVGKADAAKKFQKATKSVSADTIIEAVGRYCKSKTVADGFVCNPATWLHQERWNDLDTVTLPDDPSRPPGAVRKTASGWWLDKNGNVVVKPEFT